MKFLKCFVVLCVFALDLIGCSRATSNVTQVANAGLQKSVVYLPIVTSPLQFHSRKILLGKSGTTDVFVNRYNSDVYFLGPIPPTHLFYYDSTQDLFTLIEFESLIIGDIFMIGGKAIMLDQKRNKLYVPPNAYGELYILSKGSIETKIDLGRKEGGRVGASTINEEDGTFYLLKDQELLIIRNNVIGNRIDYLKALPYNDSEGIFRAQSITIDNMNNLAYIGVNYEDKNSFSTTGIIVVLDLKSYEMVSFFEVGSYIDGATGTGIKREDGTVYVSYSSKYANGTPIDNMAIFRNGKLLRRQLLEEFPHSFDYLIVDQHTNEVYAVSEPNWFVLYFQNEADSLVLKSKVNVTKWPANVAYDEVRRYLYTANYDTNTVSVIHEGKLLATVAVGWEPYGIGVHPETGVVYVSDTRELAITILTPYGK